MSYAFPPGGLPEQDCNPEGTAIFTEAYAVLPACTQRDIVTSQLPGWREARAWILARPMTGFSETFAQYAIEVAPGGGCDLPEPNPDAQVAIFVASGEMALTIEDTTHVLSAGGFAYVPPAAKFSFENTGELPLQLHWIRKRYRPAPNLPAPDPVITTDAQSTSHPMPGTNSWATTRFLDPNDMRHDMHINIVNFLPGGRIPFAETHVMEHGLYILQGTAKYLLNTDWVEVGPGDFLWLRAFCPQACIATGDAPFRYLLYKDVNRHVDLNL